jgi:NAD(P)-dependent dehydrogenase (short-subunit alcohol dehydrogenase family)
LTTAALPLLRKGKGKQIYTIASILGSSGSIIGRGQSVGTAYGISKAAVTFYMVSLAQDLKSEGFIVQPIHPGWVKTDMGGDGADITIDESIDGM